MLLFGAALTAAAFAFASYAPTRALLPVAAVGALGELVSRSVVNADFGPAWAAAAAAVAIGIVSYPLASRVSVPALVIVVCSIVPLLPGLSIFKGLFLMTEGDTDGLISMATALGVAVALASGVILGEYIAQPLRREARRLGPRLAGPRLIGPFRHGRTHGRTHRPPPDRRTVTCCRRPVTCCRRAVTCCRRPVSCCRRPVSCGRRPVSCGRRPVTCRGGAPARRRRVPRPARE